MKVAILSIGFFTTNLLGCETHQIEEYEFDGGKLFTFGEMMYVELPSEDDHLANCTAAAFATERSADVEGVQLSDSVILMDGSQRREIKGPFVYSFKVADGSGENTAAWRAENCA
ncbi:MAG: hypothetical protein AAGC81_13965 [Pseudomonadota bacterium]